MAKGHACATPNTATMSDWRAKMEGRLIHVDCVKSIFARQPLFRKSPLNTVHMQSKSSTSCTAHYHCAFEWFQISPTQAGEDTSAAAIVLHSQSQRVERGEIRSGSTRESCRVCGVCTWPPCLSVRMLPIHMPLSVLIVLIQLPYDKVKKFLARLYSVTAKVTIPQLLGAEKFEIFNNAQGIV